MGAILGLGVTHYPPLAGQDENMARILKRVMQDPDLPERYRRPEGWPAPMRQEYGSDEGLGAAKRHREALVAGFRDARRRLDAFAPDVVLIWGDDQYENFKEDIIPPFCVLAYESIEHRPWAEGRWQKAKNAWDEASDATFVYKGHRAAAKSLVTGLLDAGLDVSYAYRPLHHPIGHAFMNTLLASMEESGQQEMLNWMCLAGAMAELDRRPDAATFIQTYIFNSSKCFASFPG